VAALAQGVISWWAFDSGPCAEGGYIKDGRHPGENRSPVEEEISPSEVHGIYGSCL
jgi:hypothetical protein